MNQHIASMTVVVRDYDEAIAFYTKKLRFYLIENTDLGGGKRWVLVAPRGSTETRLLLAKADGPDQEAAIGHQTGGRVMFLLFTDDFARDHAAMVGAGVTFLEDPRLEVYGTVAVFEDLYGNKWDLLEPKEP